MYKSSDDKKYTKREDWIKHEEELREQRKEERLSEKAQQYAENARKNAIENNKKVKKQKAKKGMLKLKKTFFRVILVAAGIYAGSQIIINREEIIDNVHNIVENVDDFLEENLKSNKTKALDYIGEQYHDITKNIEVNDQSNGYIINIHDPNFKRYNTNAEDVYRYVEEELSQENLDKDKNDIGWLIMVNSFYGDEDIVNKYYKEPSKEKYEELAANYSNSKTKK